MKFLTVDPGEDCGWSVWEDDLLVNAGTVKMWDFSDSLWAAAMKELHDTPFEIDLPEDLQEVAGSILGIDELVTENWTLYPDVVMAGRLNWDECRTARLIGSMYACCRLTGWNYVQQPALIKHRAVAAGAETHFFHPLRENRHQNDAIMHGVYRNARRKGAAWADLSKATFSV